MNIRRKQGEKLSVRLLKNFGVTILTYGIYVSVSLLVCIHADCFTGILLFQFFIACIMCTVIGHLYSLYTEKNKQEKEIEKLKIETLQSRYNALANQINPHFFFNSLNGLTALVRQDNKAMTLEYISKLSGVFRYILQSDKKGLVTLKEELEFVDSFAYLQKVRYADKLNFIVEVPGEKQNLQIPVLSLLPLIENVVKHNMIDTENPMTVTIRLTGNNELVVSNPIQKKIEPSEDNGIGLNNLVGRFELLLGTDVRVEIEGDEFIVYLPLKYN